LLAQHLVVLDPLPARYGDLDEYGVRYLDPPVGEQLPVRLQPVLDALGVVEPVDAEHDAVGVAEVGTDLGGPLDDLLGAGEALRLRDVDRDRDRSGPHGPAVEFDDLVARLEAEYPLTQPHEVLHTAAVLEAHEIGTEQPPQQLSAARQLLEQLRRRERDV